MSRRRVELDQALRSAIEATPTPLALLKQSAARRPSHPALVFPRDPADTSPRVVTYRELAEEVEAARNFFRIVSLETRDSVAILLPGVPESVVTWIAASASGVAFPVNPLLSADALAVQLALARTRIAVVLGVHPTLDARLRLDSAAGHLPRLESIVEVPAEAVCKGAGFWSGLGSEPATAVTESDDPDRVAALFHTGGTMGEPKLAQLSGRNLVAGALMTAATVGWSEDDRILCCAPLFHVGGAIDMVLGALAAGATLILPGLLGARDPELVHRIWSLADETGTTLLAAVPTSLAAMVHTPLGGSKLEKLRAIVTGGSALPRQLGQRVESHTRRPVLQIYGMTEASGIVTAQSIGELSRTGGVGVPPPLVDVRIADADGIQLRAGEVGEVYVRGPNIFKGYLTAAGTIGTPANGEVASGDLGMIDADGQLRLTGRSKDLIIRSGHNIDPVMIEDAAYSHPDVRQAGAVSMPDAYAGELPVLYAALKVGAELSPGALGAFVADRIAEPPARPKRVWILPELPLTPFGKIARFKLRQLAAEARVAELLKEMPVDDIRCTDPACKRIRLTWRSTACDADRDAVADALGQLGLAAESRDAGEDR